MPKSTRRLFVLFVVSFAFTASSLTGTVSAAGPAGYRTRHVIVAVMDGVRFSETFGDPEHKYVPRMWREIMPQGTLYTDFRNEGITVTRQGHSTIASGTWQMAINGGPRLTMPTFFDYYREESGAAAGKTWAIFGKGSYSFAPYSSFPTYLDRWAPKAKIGIGEGSLDDDRKVLAETLAVMKEYRPALMFVNFGYTDHSAHVKPFEEYTRAVAGVDDIFATLWAAVQSDPDYRDTTTLVLTNDHGRHDDAHGGFAQHGDACEGCRHLFLLVAGPDTKKGVVIDRPALQIDIAPTVGELLGFQTPLAEGEVLADSFVSLLGLNRKEARTAVEKEAVLTRQLAARDLDTIVARRTSFNSDLVHLPATASSTLLFRGLMSETAARKPSWAPEAIQQTRAWLERTVTEKGTAQIYRAAVLLDLVRGTAGLGAGKDSATAFEKQQKELLGLDQAGLSEVDRAFLIDVLARMAALPKTGGGGQLEVLAGPLARLTGEFPRIPGQVKASDLENALVLYAISDALATLQTLRATTQGQPKPSPLSQTIRILQENCLLRYFGAAGEQKEPGGLWADSMVSLLNLSSAQSLEHAGAFRGFRSAKQLEKGKEQDEKAALPAVVLGLPAGDIAAWVQTTGQPSSKAGGTAREQLLRRRMSTFIWETNRYLSFSRDLTRYMVDEAGAVQGTDSVLAAGAFLILDAIY